MKRIKKASLLLLLATAITASSNAQSNWSTGYQAGYGTLNVNSKSAALTNQIFVSRRITNKLELEATLGCTKWMGEPITETFPTGDYFNYTTAHSVYNFTLTGKYHFIQRNKWSLYIPLSIASSYTTNKTNHSGNIEFDWLNDNKHDINIAYCVSSGLGGNVNLNKHFYLIAQFNAGLEMRKIIGNLDKRNTFVGNTVAYGGQTGIGYRL